MRHILLTVLSTLTLFAGCSDDEASNEAEGGMGQGGAGGSGGTELHSEGGAPLCEPEDVSQFVPTWRPPAGMHQGSCSDEQITNFVNSCLSEESTGELCTSFQEANEACVSCAISFSEATTQGALVQYTANALVQGNFGQCVSLFEGDTSEASCGAAIAAARDCTLEGCLGTCPYVEGQSDPFNACVEEALDTYCHGYSVTSNECEDALLRKGDPVDECLRGEDEDFATYAARLVGIFCGAE